MNGRKIILNDGTEIPGECGYSQGFLWCWFTGYTMQQAASLFFDSGKTSKIIFVYGEMQDVYEGFTNCVSLGIDVDGKVSVCMVRGDGNA